jgi:TolB-like protein
LSLLALFARPCQGEVKKPLTVAVTDFLNADGQLSVLGRTFTEEAINYFVGSSGMTVVTRDTAHINQQLAELSHSESGLVNEASMMALGNMLGARVLITGKLSKNPMFVTVNVKAVETETSRILAARSINLSGSRYRRMYNEIISTAPGGEVFPREDSTAEAYKAGAESVRKEVRKLLEGIDRGHSIDG